MSYQPQLALGFLYDKSQQAIFVRSKITVNLDSSEETLEPQETSENGATISKEYRAVPSEQPDPNIYTDEFLVKMIENVVTPQGKTDLAYARERIEMDLTDKQVEFYTVDVTVKKQDGSNGGSNSGEINQSSEIDID